MGKSGQAQNGFLGAARSYSTKLKYFVKSKNLSELKTDITEGRNGESICKPGSVEDSHSSTTAITDCL